jgi:hypothetical protein
MKKIILLVLVTFVSMLTLRTTFHDSDNNPLGIGELGKY